MSEDKTISQIMLDKLEQRQDYIAWYLLQYKKNENISAEELVAFLETSEANIERLGMCKVPDSRSSEFKQKVDAISDFTNINSFKLLVVIRKVESILALHNKEISLNTSQMAAREKDDKYRNNKE